MEIYQQPKTPFVAQFIGESEVVKQISQLKGFESVAENASAVVRPEFIQLFKQEELVQYGASVEAGIIESIKFRGSFLEISVVVNDIHLITNRSLEKPLFEIGEAVQVFIYRLYVFNEEAAYVIENPNIRIPVLGGGL